MDLELRSVFLLNIIKDTITLREREREPITKNMLYNLISFACEIFVYDTKFINRTRLQTVTEYRAERIRIPLNDKSKVTNSINVTSKGFDYLVSCWERLE